MDYIINPAWFYWIAVADALKSFFLIAAIALLIFCAITWIVFILDDDLEDEEAVAKKLKNASVFLLIGAAVFIILTIFTPSRNTLIEIQVAKLATKENSEWTVDAIKSAVDYVVSAISALE